MTRLAIVGYGKMGRLVESLAPEFGFNIVARLNRENNRDGRGVTRDSLHGAEAAVEFSAPDVAAENLQRLAELGVNTVCGTTGWNAELATVRTAFERSGAALVWGPNFSIGLNLYRLVVEEAAQLFAEEDEYGAWGWEMHHAKKKDAPSGTLLALVGDMRRGGFEREISVSSTRAGVVPGTHEIGFDSIADTITIRHTARSREGFARGALRAARWTAGRSGCYEFTEILDAVRREANGKLQEEVR